MTAAAMALLAVMAILAVADWVAVGTDRRRLEYVAKPATLVALIGVALALDPADDTSRWWFVAALVLSLAGDVFLMLPRDLFVPGLASFLLAHVAYIVGLAISGLTGVGLAVGVLVVTASLVVLARVIVGAVRAEHPELLGPVVAYVSVISVMVVVAVGTWDVRAAVGALLFYASDALIAWTRFVEPKPWGRVTIMITYHLGQAGLVLSLVG